MCIRDSIYIFGGSDQISGAVAKQLVKYGTIIRLTNNDIVAFNANPTRCGTRRAWSAGRLRGPATASHW